MDSLTQKILKLYKKNISQREIAKILKIGRTRISTCLKTHNIPIKTAGEMNALPINHNAFSNVNSHEIAYWIGFLASDGNIFKNSIKLMLSVIDQDHILKYKSFLKSEHKVLFNTSHLNGKEFIQCGISFHSTQICKDLLTHNITPNKSKTLEISNNIPEEFFPSYILGIYDGDGCFNVTKIKQARLILTSSQSISTEIQKYFSKMCSTKNNKIRQYTKSPTTYSLEYHGNKQVKNIIMHLYDKATIWLPRKKELITQFFG